MKIRIEIEIAQPAVDVGLAVYDRDRFVDAVAQLVRDEFSGLRVARGRCLGVRSPHLVFFGPEWIDSSSYDEPAEPLQAKIMVKGHEDD